MIGLGGGLVGLTNRANGLDPRKIQAFMAGAIWIPGVDVTNIGGGDHTWTSQATAASVLTTADSPQPPTPAAASNGAAVWRFNGPNGSLHIGTGGANCGPELKSRHRGTMAMWAKAGENDSGNHTFVGMWSGGFVTNRLYASTSVSGIVGAMAFNGSDTGVGDFGNGSHRYKFNIANGVDHSKWHFYEWEWDYPNGVNYSLNGNNFSTKLNVYIDGLLMPGSGYSAPPFPFATPPLGPVMGDGLWDGECRFNVGAQTYVDACWWTNVGDWLIGAVLVGYCDGGQPLPTRAQMRRVRDFHRPA